MRTRWIRTSAALVLLAAMGLAGGAARAANDFEGRVVVTLDGAMGYPADIAAPQASELRPMVVYATCHNGEWSDLWGSAQTFNRNISLGKIISGESAGGNIKLKLELTTDSDPWIKGGTGTWDISLQRKGDKLEGTYGGQFVSLDPERAKKGPLTITAKPARGVVLPPNMAAKDFVPPAPGEHPRLLFRKADLAKIRERAQTPLGQAIVSRLKGNGDAVALGFLYQLNDDRAAAQRAFPVVQAWMADRNQGAFALGREWGYKTSRVALAYDLCYDAWTPAQREEVQAYLDDVLNLCLYRKHRVGTVNWQPGSNYTVVIHAGNGLAAMALAGEKTFPPAEPVPPRMAVLKLTPPADLQVGKDVPVTPLPVGTMPTQYLYAGPFMLHFASGEDPLASVGGVAKARPEAGQKVSFRDREIAWRPLNKQTDPNVFMQGGEGGPETYGVPKGAPCIALPKLAGREQTRMFFYSVIDVPDAGWYKYQGHFWNASCYINGERIGDNEVVYLAAGKYPWMVPVAMGSPQGTAWPMFVAASEEEATKLYGDPQRAADYENAKQGYEAALARWKAAGGINPEWRKDEQVLAAWNFLCLQNGMGDGGFQGEGESYTLECHHVIHDYALAFQNVHGHAVTGQPDIARFAPRYILTTALYEEDGKTRVFNQSYGRGEETIPDRYLPRAMGLIPAAWQPAELWFWAKKSNIDPATVAGDAGQIRLIGTIKEVEPLLQMLIHYPVGMAAKNPGELLPRAWEARTRGFYAFRNGWNGKDDIIAQAYAKDGESCGWNQPEAGCFQIFAFGREMAQKVNDAAGKQGSRWFDNVVMLPEDPINAWGRGRVAYAALDEKTGSGVVTFNMDDVYSGFAGEPKKKTPVDLGIRGLRSFAADYSGKSGAPGMFVVVDKITGGKTKQWVYQLPPEGRDRPEYKFTTEANTFQITYKDGASVKGTIVAPPGAKIAEARGTLKAHPLSDVHDAAPKALLVTGEDKNDGNFLVVLTVQKGDAPAVTSTGHDLKTTVQVGGQSVRFDGEKVVVGK